MDKCTWPRARAVLYLSDYAIYGQKMALCRFEWKLTSRTLPFLQDRGFAARNHKGFFGAVKGGQSPTQRTLDCIKKAS